MKDSLLLPVWKWHHLKATQNNKVPLLLMTPPSLAIIWACWQVLGPVCHWHLPIRVNPGVPQVHGLTAVASPAHVMALPWFWDISFSIVCFSWQTFLFQALQCPSWISSLFLVLYFNSHKAVLLRRISEEGFWIAGAWLSPRWLLRSLPSSTGTLLHLLFSDTPRENTSYCSTAFRQEDKVILLKVL